jgi:heme exporter protein B
MYWLLKKEFQFEWRSKNAAQGLLLYTLSIGFILYTSFLFQEHLVNAAVWSALFWITLLFSALSAVVKSFLGDRGQTDSYYYQIASAHQLLLAKTIYNVSLLMVLFMLSLVAFSVLFGSVMEDTGLFIALGLLSCSALGSALTLLAAIAAKVRNSHLIMAVLGFPVTISILLMAVSGTRNCVDGLGVDALLREFVVLGAVNAISLAVSYLLFPYIWRS